MTAADPELGLNTPAAAGTDALPWQAQLDWQVFLSLPGCYLHPSRWAELVPPALCAHLFASARACGALSAYIHQRLQLQDCPPPADVALVRLALMPGWQLCDDVALKMGAVLIGRRIRQSLSAPAIAAWQQQLGERNYRWLMAQGSLLYAGAVPDMPAGVDVRQLGCSALWRALAVLPPALAQRISLKLPCPVGGIQWPVNGDGLWHLLRRLLHQENN